MDATDQPMLPVSLFLRLTLCVAQNQIDRTDNRLHRNPNPHGAAPKAVGRENAINVLRHERDNLAALLRAELKGRVRCDVVALVGAIVLGHAEAKRDLEALLEEMGHPGAEAVAALGMRDITGIVSAVLGKR